MMVMLTTAPKSTAPILDFALHSAQLSNIKRQQKARFLFLGKDETGLTARKTKSGVEAMTDPSIAAASQRIQRNQPMKINRAATAALVILHQIKRSGVKSFLRGYSQCDALAGYLIARLAVESAKPGWSTTKILRCQGCASALGKVSLEEGVAL